MAEARHWQKAKYKHVGANPSCLCKRCVAGWYSRRHPTREAQDAAREKYQAERGPEARRQRAIVRASAKKTVVDRLAE